VSIPVRGILVRMPEPLKMLVILYQNARSLASQNAAVVELLETHPRIAEMQERVYAGEQVDHS